MSGSQERNLIIKRGYLTGKGGFFEKRRWFVLRSEANEYRLDIYKDEKAASKGEQVKNCIMMEQVVEVQRANDRKQTFEILLPGVGYKFTANSEAEADEWVSVLHRLKSYRKERLHPDPISVPYHLNTHHPGMVVSPLHGIHGSNDMPLQSPSHLPGVMEQQFMHSPPLPRPMAIQISSQPISMNTSSNGHVVMRQDSTGAYPSPSTNSSDSSPDLVGSASTASFDQSPATEEPNGERFRISLKESEQLQMAGQCDLVISDESIILYSINSEQQLVSWPINSLRRYGLSQVCFSIDAGRGCCSGEGTFFFYTAHSKVIYQRVHRLAQQFKKSQQLALEGGATHQPLPTTKANTLHGHELSAMTSPSALYSTLCHNYGDGTVVGDHQSFCAYAGMHASPKQQQFHQPAHSTGNIFVHPQTNPISIPTTVVPTQHVMIHSPSTMHNPAACAGMYPHYSIGFQRATPPMAIPYGGFQRSLSSEEPNTTGLCYYRPDSGKKRSHSLASHQ